MESNLNKVMLFEETSLTGKSFSILLVEDNPGDVIIIRELLKSSGIDFSLVQVCNTQGNTLLCVEQ